MAEFTVPVELQSLKPPTTTSSSFSFTDFMDPNMELMGQFSISSHQTPTPSVLNLNHFHSSNNFSPFPNEIFFSHHHQTTPADLFLPPQDQNFQVLTSSDHSSQNSTQVALLPTTTPLHRENNEFQQIKKRKSMDISESCSGISTPQVSETGSKIRKNNNSSGRGKRMKNTGKEEEKSTREVVHVRARRGQATDSHSLAERVRRGKINERLRCLKDIVPGCYKTMGMAVMLDEIINYVQSLQNQVEFLSMKLAAASSYYDFNSEADAISKLQRAKANEAKELERLMRDGYGGLSSFQSTLPL